jgi:hypothetical protein
VLTCACGGFVAEWPDYMRPRIVGTVRHSSRRARAHGVAACAACGTLQEIAVAMVVNPVVKQRRAG